MNRWLGGLLVLTALGRITLEASSTEEEAPEFQAVTQQVESLTLAPLASASPRLLPEDRLYQPSALIGRIHQTGGLSPTLLQDFYETYKDYQDCGSLWWDAFLSYQQEPGLTTRFFCPKWMPEATAVHMINLTVEWFHRPESVEEHQRWHPYAACLFMAVVYNHPQALTLWEHLRSLPLQQARALQEPQFLRSQAVKIAVKEQTNLNTLGRVQEIIRLYLAEQSEKAQNLKAFPNHFTQMALSAQDTTLEAYENYLTCLALFVGKRLENQATYVVTQHRDARWMVYTPLHFFKDNESDLKTQFEPQQAITLAAKEQEMVGYLRTLREKVDYVINNDQTARAGLIRPELYLFLIDGFNFNYYTTRCAAWQHFSLNNANKEGLSEVYQAKLKTEQSSFALLNQASDFKELKIAEVLMLHQNLWETAAKIAQNQATDPDKLPWIEVTLKYMQQALTFRQQTADRLQDEYQALCRDREQLQDDTINLQLTVAIEQQDGQQLGELQTPRSVPPEVLAAKHQECQEKLELLDSINCDIPPLAAGILMLENRHKEILSALSKGRV